MRETDMPEIYVHAVKGRTLDQKRALVKDITDAVVKNFAVPVEAVTVEIVESEPTAKAKGGVLFSEMRRWAQRTFAQSFRPAESRGKGLRRLAVLRRSKAPRSI